MQITDEFRVNENLEIILSLSRSNPDNEKKIYQSLESLLRKLEDTMYDTDLPPLEVSNSFKFEKNNHKNKDPKKKKEILKDRKSVV